MKRRRDTERLTGGICSGGAEPRLVEGGGRGGASPRSDVRPRAVGVKPHPATNSGVYGADHVRRGWGFAAHPLHRVMIHPAVRGGRQAASHPTYGLACPAASGPRSTSTQTSRWREAVATVSASGSPGAGVALFVWGCVELFIVDKTIRPLLVGGPVKLPFLPTFFGLIGGVKTLGIVGLFVGPVLMALLVSIWREWAREIAAHPLPQQPASQPRNLPD